MSSEVQDEAPKPVRAKRKLKPREEAAPTPAEKKAELFEWTGEFFQKVREREPHPYVQQRLERRLQHPVCLRCHDNYRKKFPDKPFAIECQGIFSEPDFQEVASLTGLAYEEARESLDISYWASRHISMPNMDGDLVPFVAREYQNEALWCTARRQVDRWGRGLGKALPLDVDIPTPSGWKQMADLQVGDFVFDQDGKPTEVTFVSDVMYGHDCFDVVFSDGSILPADGEHLWETWTHAARKAESRKWRRTGWLAHVRKTPQPEVRTTEEIAATLLHGNGKRIENNHSIVVCGPLQYPAQDLPIDPYVLGVWLGDGTSSSSNLTSNDAGIRQEVVKAGYAVNKRNAKNDPYAYSMGTKPYQRCSKTGRMQSNGSLHSQLKALGVLNNKHIPQQYLQASVEQRLALLQGLMDTDGTISKDGSACFSNCRKSLSDEVEELVVGLGIKLTRRNKPTPKAKSGFDYRVQFTPTMPVFRLARKLERQRSKLRSVLKHRYIVEVRPRPSVPVKCIGVENPRHLYLAGRSCIPTHNTSTGVIRELHTATNRKRFEILVACPMKAQAQKWYDELNKFIDNDEQLKSSVVQRKQAPYFLIRFDNASTIAIFTTGSKSGSDADSVRSQSPKRVRIDEQDMLNPGDYKAIMPLLRRYPKESEFHGSSTPVGKREDFWAMCTQYPDYRELHFPIMVHPDWSDEMELACRREARTELNYIHEWLADFGDQEGGCFRAIHVDQSLANYTYAECVYDRTKKHVLGVDWNGQGTGTRFRVVQFDPVTSKRRTVDQAMVNISTMATLDELVRLNRKWHCDYVYVDAGFGFVQDELIRMIGQNSNNPDDKKLLNVQVIDFGARLETNKLVINRDKAKYIDENELERPTKPFMVEGCMMAMEQGFVELSREDRGFEEQIRAYRVKSYTKNGWASTYISDVGDHDLDAWMLAMLGVEQHWGISFVEKPAHGRASISFVNGFGEGSVLQGNPADWQRPPETARTLAQKKGNVPGRASKPGALEAAVKQSSQTQVLTRDIYGTARTVLTRPPASSPHNSARGVVPSRTSGFSGGLGAPSRAPGRGGYRR